MRHDFDRFATLDDESLRRVLDGDDAPARLHALWTLASRHGAQALTARVGGEPSPGVRRHACVLLAAADVDLLVHFARLDPDPGVRGTASTFVTRLAAGGRLPWALVTERLGDPVARRAVLEALGGAPPPEVVSAVRVLAGADDRQVATAALRALWLVARETALSASVAAVARPDLTGSALAIWAEHAGRRSIHEALRSAPVAARLAAIRLDPLGRPEPVGAR